MCGKMIGLWLRESEHQPRLIGYPIPGAVKMFTLSVFEATGAVTPVVSFSPFVPSICAVHLVLLSMSDRCRIVLRLPPASLGATIYVEYLSSYLIGLRQIENSVDDIFCPHDFPHGLQLFERVFGLILMQR